LSSYPPGHRRARGLTAAAAITVALGGLVSACGSSSHSSAGSGSSSSAAKSGSSGSPYRVLYICPLSGQLAAAGAAELDGLKAAAAQVNSQGGVLGHQVTITPMDDQGTGTKAVSDAQQALSSGTQYNLILGGCFGQDGIPVSAAFAKTPVVQISPLPDALIKSGKYPYVFLAGSLTSAPEVAMATNMKNHGVSKFAIVTGDDATGQTGAQELQAAAKALGMTVTATEFVPDTAVDATSQFQAALATHPDAIAVNNFTPAIGPILKARTKLGATVPVYGDAYFSALNLAAVTTPQDRKGVIEEAFPFLVHGTSAQQTATWQAFEKFDAQFDPKPLLSLYADMTSWDALMEARAAAVKAGTISGSSVPQALAGISAASSVPGFLGGTQLNSPSYHAWVLTPGDYTYPNAGISKGGIIYPGT
jgi:ABC-type branched-subunit amino acid transport system substrate-binding protein